jgi:two-component system response regulator
MSEAKSGLRRILYAEDNFDDVELLRLALEHSASGVQLHHVENGVACMQYLRSQSRASLERPDLLLLDLNMPAMDGFEVMEAILRDEVWRSLPVIVLTTSIAPEDVERMYRLRCSTYIRKPLELQGFRKAVQTIVDYWFKVATLPTS